MRRVRVRILPWRPRWRGRKVDAPDFSPVDVADDPVKLVIALLVGIVLAPALILFAASLIFLGLEVLFLLPVSPLFYVGRLLGLQPWHLVLTFDNGSRGLEEVRGTRHMWRRRAELRAQRRPEVT